MKIHRRHLACASFALLVAGCATPEFQNMKEALSKVPGLPVPAGLIERYKGDYQKWVTAAIVAQELAKFLSALDREKMAQASAVTLETGQEQTWSNAETGVKGTTKVVNTRRQVDSIQLPKAQPQITAIPTLELVGRTYKASQAAQVHSAPRGDAQVIATLQSGETAEVTGKVKDADWYYLSKNGVGFGFSTVASFAKDPEGSLPATAATEPPAGTAQTVKVEREYKTISQEIVLPDGTIKKEEISLVKNAAGKWVRADTAA